MTTTDWMIVGATLLGPILAVQAQKWVERAGEKARQRMWIFMTLMATRQARLSFEHVRALNSIDLAFYGRRVLGKAFRRPSSQAVLDAWHEYYRHLSTPTKDPESNEQMTAWKATGDELFYNLLQAMAIATRHQFERQHLRAGSYSPIAHGRIEDEQSALRNLALDVLAGGRPINMNIGSWPVNAEAVEQQKKWQGDMLSQLKELTDKAAHK